MTFRRSLLLPSGVGLLVSALGCGPQVDAESPGASGSSGTTNSEATSTSPTTSDSSPVDPEETQGVTTAVPEPTGLGSSESTGMPNHTGGSGGPGDSESSTGRLPALDCAPLCDVLIDGSCLGETDSCLVACEMTVRDQGPAVEAAFATCVATEYLCFSLLEDCMWSELYGPKPVAQEYAFEGEGFDAWNGRSVFAHVSAGVETSSTESAVVVGGEVTIETSLSTTLERFGNSRSVYLFVDVDDDGSCTPGVDHAQVVWMQSLGSAFAELNFVIPGAPTELSSEGLCDQF